MKQFSIRPVFFAFAAGVCAIAFTGCGGSDEDSDAAPAAAAGVLQEALDRYDGDDDGVLSEAERQKMESDFLKRFDADGDGNLDGEERATARRNSKSTVVAGSRAPVTKESAGEFLKRFDSDGDGKVSQAEAGEKRWKVMARTDRDGDGFLTVDEWVAGNTSLRAARTSE